jgi:hypothetical protein
MSLLNQSAFQDNTFKKSIVHHYDASAASTFDQVIGMQGGLVYENRFCRYQSGVLTIKKDGDYTINLNAKCTIVQFTSNPNLAIFRLVAGSHQKVIQGGATIPSLNEFGVTDSIYAETNTSTPNYTYRKITGSIQTGFPFGGVRVHGFIYTQITATLQAGETIYLRYNHSLAGGNLKLFLDGELTVSEV